MRIAVVFVTFGLLAACSTRAPEPLAAANPIPTGVANTCGAAPYGYLIGQNATALERVLILRQVRVTRPNTTITQDLRPAQINFNIGADERIRAITCG